MNRELYIVIGAFGSGKSEYSIHLARKLKAEGQDVVLADMDVVNPYFRSRDVREEFAAYGIDVIAPEGEYKHADLPMISPSFNRSLRSSRFLLIPRANGFSTTVTREWNRQKLQRSGLRITRTL